MSQLQDRYPGLRPFKMEDADLFFGRDREIQELTALVASERTTVVFGASGVGKSSLLNTAFLKSTELQAYHPLRIRFSAFSEGGAKKEEDGPLQIVNKQLEKQIPELGLEPVLYNKDNPKLWEHVKRAELLTAKDYSKKLLLIFDQFEEFFYFDHTSQKHFNQLLAEIVHEQTPTRILEWATGLSYEKRTPEVLEWYKQPDIKIIFSIRSDKLSAMNHMVRYMPQILKNRMELRPFSILNARETIHEPALLPNPKDGIRFNSPCIIIDKKVVTRITNDLKNAYEEIEGAFLQIVCYSIENQVKELVKDLPDKLIKPFEYGEDLFDKQINIATILDKFYLEQISRFSEKDADLIKRIIEDDLVNDGERTSLNKSTLEKKLGSHDYLIRDLLDARLIREENTVRGLTYELSHDKLIAPVEKSKARRLQEEKDRIAADLVQQQNEELVKEQYLRRKAEYARLKARKLSILIVFLCILFVIVGATFIIKLVDLEKIANQSAEDSKRYLADAIFSKAVGEFDNSNYYAAFNLLYTSDSIKHSANADSMFRVIASCLFMGQSISRSDDGSIVLTRTKDSILQIWNKTSSGYRLQAYFGGVAYFIPARDYNKLIIGLANNRLKIFDLISNREIGNRGDVNYGRDGFGNNVVISDNGEVMIYKDTSREFNIKIFQLKDTVQEIKDNIATSVNAFLHNQINSVNAYEDQYLFYGISIYIKITRNGNVISIISLGERASLHYFDLKGTKSINNCIYSYEDEKVYYVSNDTLISLDIKDYKTKRVRLFNKKMWFENSKLNLSIHHPFIHWFGFQEKNILYNYVKNVFISGLGNNAYGIDFKFDSLGVIWLDSSDNVRYCANDSNNPIILATNSSHANYSDVGFVKNKSQFYVVRGGTISIRNLDGSTVQDMRIPDIYSVITIDSDIIHAVCKTKSNTVSQVIISRKKLEKTELRKIIPYLTPELKRRYGISQ